jgi:tetratricopeptide (TPR) repeat protein
MRHRAGQGEASEAETLPIAQLDEVEVEDEAVADAASIDHLLAVTDDGWDIDDQVVTLQRAAATTHAAVDASNVSARDSSRVARPSKGPPPLPRKGPPPLPAAGGRTPEPAPLRTLADILEPAGLVDILQARAARLEPSGDKVGRSRAYVELAIASEILLADDKRAATWAEAALQVDPSAAAAHGILRRAHHGRAALSAMLDHLDHELSAATHEAHRVELLSERARLLEAVGARSDETRAAWEQALAYSPENPAALKGLEAELVARTLSSASPGDWDALAGHLGRMADAFAADPALASWLHVERARVLERKLDRIDAARSALERAVEVDPNAGPVRDAFVRHVAAQSDWAALVHLLDDEARVEPNDARAARLELDAAMIATWRLGEGPRARVLLERAAARGPTSSSVDRRVLDELIRLAEAEARWADAARARRARLRFIAEPSALAYELGALAAIAERQGEIETAIADVQRALAVDNADSALVDWLDRLLRAANKPEQRVATWLQEAARTHDSARQARALTRAGRVCEEIGRPADALRHLRAAWVAHPGDPDALDGLTRVLAPLPPAATDGGARSLVEVYTQAADDAREPGRKVAFLERVAIIWEELLGDPSRASRVYEQILAIDRDRQSAMVGLQRTSLRTGDDRNLARALLDEARVVVDRGAQLALRVRAADVLSKHDAARAIQLVREVIDENPRLVSARELETRLYEEATRWELVARSLRARIDLATTPRDKVALWLSLAQIQSLRLRAPADALASLERARAIDPSHPVPAEEATRVLEAHGDARGLRDMLERLASNAVTPEERARRLAHAAEIDELRLGDDASAVRTYQRALAETPDDDWLADRLARLMTRRARRRGGGELAELASLLGKRIERAPSVDAKRVLTFELASLLVESGQEPMRATSLLESLLADRSDHVPALRTLEWLRRRATVDVASLARVLGRQAAAFTATSARLGALWNLAALEEWVLPSGDPAATYRAILDLDPTDPAALGATLRQDLAQARRGEPGAKNNAIAALRALVPFSANADTRVARELRLALMLESAAADAPEPAEARELLGEALHWYRDTLGADERSLTAATGAARLGSALGDPEAALAASIALADLADEPRLRARCLLDAAEILLGAADDPRLGLRADRRQRAVALLERALDADPDSIPAAGRLATVLLEERQGERLLTHFSTALNRSKSPEAVVMFGSEIARVARDELHDLPVAIDAMRRVRALAPQHIPSLLTLAELCIAQRVWPDAVDALEAVVSTSREIAPKLTALFALASIYEKVLARPAEVDRVLRAALAIEPSNVRALRALLRRMTSEPPKAADNEALSRRREIAELLSRLADAENDPEIKSGILMEMSEVHLRIHDAQAAERALVAAVAIAPSNARAFARLTGMLRTDPAGQARALSGVIAIGERIGHADARWFAALGRTEIGSLNRPREGIAHLERAIELDPTLFEARFELASAYAASNANDRASQVLVGMLDPAPHPLLSLSDPSMALALLEQTLTASDRGEEAIVVSELRSMAGDLDDGRRAWLHARRIATPDAQHAALDRATLVTHVLPGHARHVLLEVAAAIAGAESKMLRSEIAELGISPRDRIPSRSGHPVRLMLDRVMRQLGVSEAEMVISRKVTSTRVLAQDTPWVVVPASLIERSETVQLASLARAVARIAYGVPWLRELSPEHVQALLVAAARQVVAGYGTHAGTLTAPYETSLARALTRRQRRLLEELVPHLGSTRSTLPDPREFVDALVCAELRTAFLITGDLLALIENIAFEDDPSLADIARSNGSSNALATVVNHPRAGEIIRFALTPAATALRVRLGTVWSGTSA